MVRSYKRKTGARKYANFTPEVLEQALREIKSKKKSLREASKIYGISLGTLSHKLRGKHSNQIGHPLALTEEEEINIVKNAQSLGEWGFPLDLRDTRKLVYYYLSKAGKNIPQFKNNYPSKEWALGFLKRHKNHITLRNCQNIKKNRSAVSAKMVEEFFVNLKETTQGVEPTNIFNYDETNLSDNPGIKKCLFKRGVKYPERIRDFSKSAISIMFCGNAMGQMLPAYVVYKSENLWTTWMEGGPARTRYGRTKSGWFDAFSFDDWFNTIFLPAAKKLPGTKVLIGDNLSSHFTELVLSECEKCNIKFCCLPANSTHLLQPLDVAFYGPLKRYWRQLLDEWKMTVRRKSQTLTKEEFPKLLFKLYTKLYPTGNEVSANMQAGFKACGIYPLDPQHPLKRLPDYQPEQNQVPVQEHVSTAVIEVLREFRGVDVPAQRQKKKKINVQPGKSISVDDLKGNHNDSNTVEEDIVHEETEHEEVEELEQEPESDIDEAASEYVGDIKLDKFYLIQFKVKALVHHYVGKVISIDDLENQNVEIAFLRMSTKVNYKFFWPQVPDEGIIPISELLTALPDPQIDRRGAFLFGANHLRPYLKSLQ